MFLGASAVAVGEAALAAEASFDVGLKKERMKSMKINETTL